MDTENSGFLLLFAYYLLWPWSCKTLLLRQFSVPRGSLPLISPHTSFGGGWLCLAEMSCRWDLCFFFLTGSFPKSACGVGEAPRSTGSRCAAVACAGGEKSALCSTPIQSLSKTMFVCLPQPLGALPWCCLLTWGPHSSGGFAICKRTLAGVPHGGWMPEAGSWCCCRLWRQDTTWFIKSQGHKFLMTGDTSQDIPLNSSSSCTLVLESAVCHSWSWVRWDPEQDNPLLWPRAIASLLSILYFIVAHSTESFSLFIFIVASKGLRQRRVLSMLVVVQWSKVSWCLLSVASLVSMCTCQYVSLSPLQPF